MRPDPTRCLLLIDDEPAQRRLVTAIGARAGWWVRGAPDVDAAREDARRPAGARRSTRSCSTIGCPATDGTELIEQIRALRPDLPLLVLTAQTSVAVAVDAMRAGANDFLVKPIAPDRLLAALNAATDRRQRGAASSARCPRRSPRPLAFEEIVGSAPPFRSALADRRQGRPRPRLGADRGRERLGQGSDRPGDPRRQPARPQADDHRQLRRDPRESRRIGAVRP